MTRLTPLPSLDSDHSVTKYFSPVNPSSAMVMVTVVPGWTLKQDQLPSKLTHPLHTALA